MMTNNISENHYDLILIGSGMGALTGADVAGLGVTGAMMGGFMCLGHLPDGLRMPSIVRAASRYR